MLIHLIVVFFAFDDGNRIILENISPHSPQGKKRDFKSQRFSK